MSLSRISLTDKRALEQVRIIDTKVEPVTAKHKTPWLKQWTLHSFEIPEDRADQLAETLSQSLDNNYWYADFKNDVAHYIVFPNKVFKIDRSQPEQYRAATEYGLTLNIPSYQLDFSPAIKQWERPTEPMHENESETQLAKKLQDATAQVSINARYMHYKQRSYRVLHVALREEDNEPCVVYQAEYGSKTIWVRPLSSWLEEVEINTKHVKRFTKLD